MCHVPLPLTVSCFSKIQIGFTFLVLAHPGSPGKRAVKWVCVCVCVCAMCVFINYVYCVIYGVKHCPISCSRAFVFCVIVFRKLVCDPKVKLKYQHLITNSFVEVRGVPIVHTLIVVY